MMTEIKTQEIYSLKEKMGHSSLQDGLLLVFPQLIKKHGILGAVLLSYMHNHMKREYRGYNWANFSMCKFVIEVGLSSPTSVSKKLNELQDNGIIEIDYAGKTKYDHSKWYRIIDKDVHGLFSRCRKACGGNYAK